MSRRRITPKMPVVPFVPRPRIILSTALSDISIRKILTGRCVAKIKRHNITRLAYPKAFDQRPRCRPPTRGVSIECGSKLSILPHPEQLVHCLIRRHFQPHRTMDRRHCKYNAPPASVFRWHYFPHPLFGNFLHEKTQDKRRLTGRLGCWVGTVNKKLFTILPNKLTKQPF